MEAAFLGAGVQGVSGCSGSPGGLRSALRAPVASQPALLWHFKLMTTGELLSFCASGFAHRQLRNDTPSLVVLP